MDHAFEALPVGAESDHHPWDKQYYKSAMWAELGPTTQMARRAFLERLADHKGVGDKPIKLMLARQIRNRRDNLMATPEAANTTVKALRQLFRFAVRYDHLETNPAADVELMRSKSEGYHSWSWAEIAKFEEAHSIGTTARQAFALALYTA